MTMTSNTLEKPVELGFHFDDKKHIYYLDGKKMYGVTSILGVIAKPMLIQWAANCACDYIIATLPETNPEIHTGELRIDRSSFESIIKEARTAHRKKKEDAGEKGTDVHGEIERLVRVAIDECGGYMTFADSAFPPQIELFVKWAQENNVRFLESEKRVYSESGWYAGTCDLVFEMDGKKWIGDVKTGRAIYPEYYLQMAAYQNALEEMEEHTDIHGAMVINLKKTGGIEIGQNYDYEGNKLAFLGALTLFKQLQALTK
jgi:hypothetical protein